MRLPKDHNNWHSGHARRVIDRAWKLFEQFEARVDLENTDSVNEHYAPYDRAKRMAIEVANVVGTTFSAEALKLP